MVARNDGAGIVNTSPTSLRRVCTYVSAFALSVVIVFHAWFRSEMTVVSTLQRRTPTRRAALPLGRRADDGVWFNFSAPPSLLFFAYSAFVDVRTAPAAAAGAKVVRVMAVSTRTEELRQRGVALLCVHRYADGRPATVSPMLDPMPIGMGWPLYGFGVREYIYACPMASRDAWPTSLSITTNSSPATNNTLHPAMPVEVPHRYDGKKALAVCVQAAYRHVNTVRLVEWLEFQRLLGVSQVGVYIMSDLSASARRVFRYYADVERLVALRHTDYIERVVGGSETSPDQFWLHLTPVINDCLYRNMFRYRRIGVMDFDEVIVPRRNWTRLVEMVEELHRNYSSSGYVFRNNYFFLDLPRAANETSNVTFVQHRLKVALSGPGYSVKTIIDPTTCVGMHNHYCWGFIEDVKRHHHDVDPTVAVLQHYKRCHFSADECRQIMNETYRDETILKYRRQLTRAVSRKLTSFYRWSNRSSRPTPYPPLSTRRRRKVK